MPTCFLNWKVEIRNTLGAQIAHATVAKKIIQSQGGFKIKHVNKFLQGFFHLSRSDLIWAIEGNEEVVSALWCLDAPILSSEMVGVFAWNALKIFTQISSFKFWKCVLFFLKKRKHTQKTKTQVGLKTRLQGLTTVLSIVTFRVVKTSDFLGLTGLSPEPSSPLTNFSFTLGQQPGPGFGD